MSGTGRAVMTADDEDGTVLDQEQPGASLDILNSDDGAAANDAGQQTGALQQPAQGQQEQVPDYEIILDDGNQQDDAAPNQPNDQQAGTDQRQGRDDNRWDGRFHERKSDRAQRRKAQRQKLYENNSRLYAENQRLRTDVDTMRTQMEEMRRQVGSVAPKIDELTEANIRSQRDSIERRAAEAERSYEHLDEEYWQAIDAGDNQKARQLLRQRDEAHALKVRFGIAKEEFDRQVGARQQPQRGSPREDRQTQETDTHQPARQQQQVDPVITRHATDFIDNDAPWYREPGNERDVAALNALEAGLASEGWDPRTREFWDELYDRAARAMPDRFPEESQPAPQQQRQTNGRASPARQAAPQQQPARRGPPTGAPGTARPASGNPNRVRLTEHRRASAIAAGYMDDQGTVIDRAKFNKVAQEWAAEDRAAQRAGR